jgi:hypothetical protein
VGLNFFLGIVIYLLIVLTLMVWFLKYHGNNGQSNPKSDLEDLEIHNQDEANSSPTKPNQILMDFMQSGGQSVSEKSEVLPGHCGQPNSLKIL